MFQIAPGSQRSESATVHNTEETCHDVEKLQEVESAGL